MKVPRFGEIWWCFPKGDSEEPNHAIVYNVRENTWYDTALPNGGRGAGLFPTVFSKPLMSGVAPTLLDTTYRITQDGDMRITEDGNYRITEESNDVRYKFWMHEQGVDEIDGLNLQPIQSYFETADISLPVQSQQNRAIQVLIMEPDFVQTGPITVEVRGRANARGPEVDSEPRVIVETPQTPQEQIIYFKDQRREMRFRFESNCLGGNYQMGLILAHVQPADATVIG